MTPKEWRAAGFHTIFRADRVYLLSKTADSPTLAWSLSTSGGFWTDDTAPETWPALLVDKTSTALLADLAATAAACYCDQGVDTCDFCAGLRTPPARCPDCGSTLEADGYCPACAASTDDPGLDAHMDRLTNEPPLTEDEAARFEAADLRRLERR